MTSALLSTITTGSPFFKVISAGVELESAGRYFNPARRCLGRSGGNGNHRGDQHHGEKGNQNELQLHARDLLGDASETGESAELVVGDLQPATLCKQVVLNLASPRCGVVMSL